MIQPPRQSPATWLDLDLSDTHESTDLPDTHVNRAPMLMGTVDTCMTLDSALPGKQHGHLILPHSDNAGPSQLRVPVCAIRGHSDGPTVVMIAGIHGDEYEGPLTLHRMARDLTAKSIHGCLIIVPAANGAGLLSGERCLPGGTEDLDSCFPGSPTGSTGERLAHALFTQVIRHADLVLDLRSGGKNLDFVPLAAVRFMGVSYQREASEAAMIAFGALNSVRFPASSIGSCLQAAVDDVGIAYVQSELAGGAGCSPEALEVAETGCCNVVCSMGVLREEVLWVS